MQFTTLLVAASALVAGASASYNGSIVYTTEVHTAYTTYCPEATKVTFNGQTYTVTDSSTLTITNCPCTILKPVATYSSVPTAPVYVNSTAAGVTATSPAAIGTGAPVPSPTGEFTGSANKAFVASGAGLAGLLGLAAYIL